ncbi:UNVERIFIED_CONTAM: Kelch domain-containing protein 3 [Sesamum radiatum]|uniref:Kelch domain-containing protein 3 n=1 Tax=Sesamum radiatum TaxID=300843 RepID=A0AAW2S4R8_SESRA
MGSLGEVVARNKAMWLCPKMMGSNPSERWGHSACYFNGLLYIFGNETAIDRSFDLLSQGCRGGVHFSDVLVCNLATMTWSILKTSGPGPGPRDSHSAVLVGHRMIVFGGTNGSKKVNDLHVLDLVSQEWMRPECSGNPPSARESHTANVVGDEKLVVFGGSGEGDANYLNDLHILDLENMEWSSPEVSGNVPAPRDSHSAVAVGNRLFVFGGDSGDRYQGDVSVLDLNKLIWSRLDVCEPSPGARAGHAAVYILGGVGDKQYYSDIWVLDVITSSWDQLDLCSPKSQGRFSHTATVTTMGIAIFGGCGEDERPLNELLILPIDSLTCRAFGNMHKDGTKMFFNKTENNKRTTILIGDAEDVTSVDVEELESVPKQPFCFSSDAYRAQCNAAESLSMGRNLGPDVVLGGAILGQQPSLSAHQIAVNHANSGQSVACSRLPQQPAKMLAPPPCHSSEQTQSRRSSPENRAILALGKDSRVNTELQGVVLTLASPGSAHGGL